MWSYFTNFVMGSYWSSQFLHALRVGDTAKACKIYQTRAKLRDNLQPNAKLGSEHSDNTLLHYAALYGMKDMYENLLRQNGKPDMKNSQRRNCLHLICLCADLRGIQDSTKRQMLELTVKEGLQGMDLKHLLAEKDEDGNTALHLAAGAGLKECVELLLNHEADMVVTNNDGLTPADLAKAKEHGNIATSLEAKMVLSDLEEPVEADCSILEEAVETHMQDRDLRSMKDALLIETSEMLGVSLQSAEVLLKHYGWSKEELLQAWLENPEAVCEDVGVEMPSQSTHDFLSSSPPLQASVATTGSAVAITGSGAECAICCLLCDSDVQVTCGHHFCRSCWKEYLEEKITRGESQSITCPEYGCYKLVPPEVIESVVSQDMAVKFLSFDIKAFVDSNPNIRWCPHPGCCQAVGRPSTLEQSNLSPSHSSELVKGQTVACGSGHYFCWDCLGEAHEPCSCKQWQKWLEHCKEMKPKIGETTAAEADEAASSRWLVDYSKPCPKCTAPIEKTEGCNHMCCKHCRHDFCWVCLEDWKRHNSSTGGYFNCNRYDAQLKARESLHHRREAVLRDCKDWEEMSKFLHYYERFKEHIKSYELEEPFLDKAQEKMIELAQSVRHLEFSNVSEAQRSSFSGSMHLDLSFIQEAVVELLKGRRVLKATYAYGYYLTGLISKKQFEHMQGALEQVIEMLAEAVARPHLRKPRLEIIRLTREAKEKRVTLIKNVHRGLPLSSHPFIDSAGLGASGSHNSRLRRLLQDLDAYTPRGSHSPTLPSSSTSSDWPHTTDSDTEFMRAMEMSRQEFEADQQMTADVELAKKLSLRIAPPQRGGTSSPVGNSWLDQYSNPFDTEPWLRLQEPAPAALRLTTPPSSPPPLPPSPPPSPSLYLPRNTHSVLESMPESGSEWGPIYSEEEDLRMAIQDSLQDSRTSQANCNDMVSITGDAVETSATSRSKRSYSLASPTSHDRSYSCSDAGSRTSTRRADVLVTGHKLSKPKANSHSQFVGYHRPRRAPPLDSAPALVNRSHRKRHSTTPRAHSNIGPLPELPHDNEDSNTLPSSIRQLLDSQDRIGTNV